MSIRQFIQSMRFAGRGFRYVWQTEQNLRIQVPVFILVLIAGAALRVRAWEFVVLLIVGGSVLMLECVNSAVERLTDLVQPRLHGYVREVKDIMAAAVLLAAIGAVIIGLVIFVPHFIAWYVA